MSHTSVTIKISLTEAERKALAKLATKERRDIGSQAACIVQGVLKEMGYLDKEYVIT